MQAAAVITARIKIHMAETFRFNIFGHLFSSISEAESEQNILRCIKDRSMPGTALCCAPPPTVRQTEIQRRMPPKGLRVFRKPPSADSATDAPATEPCSKAGLLLFFQDCSFPRFFFLLTISTMAITPPPISTKPAKPASRKTGLNGIDRFGGYGCSASDNVKVSSFSGRPGKVRS